MTTLGVCPLCPDMSGHVRTKHPVVPPGEFLPPRAAAGASAEKREHSTHLSCAMCRVRAPTAAYGSTTSSLYVTALAVPPCAAAAAYDEVYNTCWVVLPKKGTTNTKKSGAC